MTGKVLLEMYGGCGPDLTGSSMGLTLGDTKVMVDSGEFQGHTANSVAKALLQLRNNFKPNLIVATHAHVDHVIGLLFGEHSGSLPRNVKCLVHLIVADQLRTVFLDALGLQNKRNRIAKTINNRIVEELTTKRAYEYLLAILESSGAHDTDEILQNYGRDLEDNIRFGGAKKGTIKWMLDKYRKTRNEMPKHKSARDIAAMLADIDTALADLGSYKSDYSRKNITQGAVDNALKRAFGVPYGQPYKLETNQSATVTLYPAGHILGSAWALVSLPLKGDDASKGDGRFNVGFSGDMGRIKGTPFLPGPKFPKSRVDAVVLESTYGDRVHTQSYQDAMAEILDLQRTAPGDCLVATISYQKGPENLINSLGTDAKSIFYTGRTLHDFRSLFMRYGGEAFQGLSNARIKYIYDLPETLGLPNSRSLIVAPSGMLFGKSNDIAIKLAPNKNSRIIFTNFLTENSPGHRLMYEDTGDRKIKTELGEMIPFKGDVFHVKGASGHGDRDDLVEIAFRYVKMGAKTIVLNHGGDQREPLAGAIRARLHKEGLPQPKILIPQNGDQIDLTTGKIVTNLLQK